MKACMEEQLLSHEFATLALAKVSAKLHATAVLSQS
jgi:hypothetical protein